MSEVQELLGTLPSAPLLHQGISDHKDEFILSHLVPLSEKIQISLLLLHLQSLIFTESTSDHNSYYYVPSIMFFR